MPAILLVAAQVTATGDATIRAPYGGSEIVITTTDRLAGAIHSLRWNGREFIDSTDHGRQLQSAANFDAGSTFTGETFNPTEAGSRFDGAGPTSSSRLLHRLVSGNQLQTTTQMAFWLRPGERSGGHPAKNTTVLSNHLLTRRVTIGMPGMPNALVYDVTFSVPVGEQHTYAQFEAVTGYMPAAFSQFFVVPGESGKVRTLSDGPGEQQSPVMFSTESGRHAMGVYSPQQPSPGYEHAGYGRWRFAAQKVVKWNCVFRVRDRDGIAAGEYSYRCYVVVGDRNAVVQGLRKLQGRFAGR